jgi:hypothetical protein
MEKRKKKKLTKAQILKLNPRPSVVFLLNRERVLGEMATLAKMHIAELLDVKVEQVTCDLELRGGKIIPTFNVDAPQAGALEAQYIQKGIAEVWLGWAKRELVDRLRGLGEVRRYGEESRTNPDQEIPQEAASEKAAPDADPGQG